MSTLCKTVLRGFGMAVCVSLLALTAQAADSSLSGKRDEAKSSGGSQVEQIKPGLDLGLAGYTDLIAPDAAAPNKLYGAGWVGVTKDNMAEYDF